MRHIGIDISKLSFNVFIPPAGNYVFSNDSSGFGRLHRLLDSDDIVGMESTGNYHQKLALFLLRKKLCVKILNPIMVNQFIRSTVRKKKTDRSDAVIISKLLEQGEGYEATEEQLTNTIRKLTRTKQKLVQQRSSIKILLKSTKTDTADCSFLRKTFIRLIKNYDREIEKLEKEILKKRREESNILESIPGISALFACAIVGELGDIGRFSQVKQVVAYAGLDPKISQSGHSVNRKGSLTKRGSSLLRQVLFLAAFANITRDNVFSRYYKKKRSEGKHYYQAMTATSRKILEVCFILLKKHEFFLDSP